MHDHAWLWQQLLGNEAALAAVLARMSPATIRHLRVAALPGDRSGARGLGLLRARRLCYCPDMSERHLPRVVALPTWVHWHQDIQKGQQLTLSRAGRFAGLQAARLYLPGPASQVSQLVSACAAHLTRLRMHRLQMLDLDWEVMMEDDDDGMGEDFFDRGAQIMSDPLPRQMSQLRSLRHLALGRHGQHDEGWWLVPSVAPLRGLTGLRELCINTLPADLARLTQITLLQACLSDAFLKAPLPDLAPIAALPALRHLTLTHATSRAFEPGYWVDRYTPAQHAQLQAAVGALTALTALELRMVMDVGALPPLPELRSLATSGGLQVGALRQVPQLTRLEARRLLGWQAAAGTPPQCPLLQHATLWCLDGLAAVAPQLQHLTCLDQAEGDTRQLAQLSELRSLQLPEYFAVGFSPDLGALLGSRCTRVVLTHFDADVASLPLCRGARELDLSFCMGADKCQRGACAIPADMSYSPIYADDAADAADRAASWLGAMQGSGVVDLTLRYGNSDWFDVRWLQPLAAWGSLQRLVLDGGDNFSSSMTMRGLDRFAAACRQAGSPLRHIELCMRLTDHWVQERLTMCAAVEAAHPGITCTAPLPGL